MKHFKHILAALALALTAAACTDEIPVPDTPGEGEADVTATLTFQPLVGAEVGSRSDGQAIKYIDNLVIFVYNEAGVLQRLVRPAEPDLVIEKDAVVELPTDPGKVDGPGHQAEEKTCRATFTMHGVGYGKYRFYAVANTFYTESDATLKEKYKMLSELRKQTVEWQANAADNAQMFGYFTTVGAEESAAGFSGNVTVIDRRSVSLHAWLKRLASKVTVVYDGSGLHQGINIYIKSVTIKDIPRYCKLGMDNTVGTTGQGAKIVTDSLITDGESIHYNVDGIIPEDEQSPSWEQWLQINKGGGLKGAVTMDGQGQPVTHSETDEALYFYENVQGNYPDRQEYDKRQQKGELGTNITKPEQQDYKDRVPNGTYIEVEAYYVADNPMGENYESRGKIKYRFMLGMDTKFNYNAYRNHHYKLTLGFKGYANQPDWHIEYIEQDPFIETPPIFYMPYRYNQESVLPIRIKGNVIDLEAEIIENNWGPYSPEPNGSMPYDSVPPAVVGKDSDPLAFRWARDVYYGTGVGYDTYSLQNRQNKEGTAAIPTEERDKVTPIFAGFMSIGVAKEYESLSTPIPATLFAIEDGYEYSSSNAIKALKDNFYGNSLNYRRFSKEDIGESGIIELNKGTRNECVIRHLDDGSVTFGLPLWTRQKTLLGISGFTGNNPYDTYQRKAMIRVTAHFDKGNGETETRVRYIPIYQVRRVVNPKGVWRRHDDNSSFHVQLMRRPDPEPETSFETFESNGVWEAEVTAGASDLITLIPAGGARTEGGKIVGDTGTPIDFTIQFTGTVSQGETKCAIVRVLYHGKTCQHTIFVRKGYRTPLAVVDGGAEWSSFSLYSCQEGTYASTMWPDVVNATVTQSPLALGTFFKRCNYTQGILVENNDNKDLGPLVAPNTHEFKLTDGTTSLWKDIKGLACASINAITGKLEITSEGALHRHFKWAIFKAKVNTSAGEEERYYRVPSYDDFRLLEEKADYGLGVLYADGAVETATKPDEVYGYTDPDNNGGNSTYGMRGVFVYNPDDGRQIFFPLGKNGMGRRTIQNAPDIAGRGMLRYSSVLKELGLGGKNSLRPIPYNMPASPGAIYWILQNPNKTNVNPGGTINKDYFGWDMNYFDFNFNAYGAEIVIANDNAGRGGVAFGDALPIKLVRMTQAEVDAAK